MARCTVCKRERTESMAVSCLGRVSSPILQGFYDFSLFSVDFNEMRYFNFKWNWMGNFNIWARTGVIRKAEAPFAAGFQLQPRTEQRPCFYFVFVSVFLSPLTLSLSFVVDTVFVLFVFCLWHWLCLLCHRLCCVFFSCSTDLSSACLFLSHENALFPQNGSICRKRGRNIGIKQKILQGGQVANIGRLNLFWFDIIWDKPQWKTNIIICLWKCPNTSFI